MVEKEGLLSRIFDVKPAYSQRFRLMLGLISARASSRGVSSSFNLIARGDLLICEQEKGSPSKCQFFIYSI